MNSFTSNFGKFRLVVLNTIFAGALCLSSSVSAAEFSEFLSHHFNATFSSDAAKTRFMDELVGKTEISILHVTSDAMKGTADLSVVMDANHNVTALRFNTTDHEGNHVSEYSVDQLRKGAVLLSSDGMETVKITSRNFNVTTGGPVEMRYLENGIFKTYGTFQMELLQDNARDDRTRWFLQTNDQSGRREFHQMRMKANKWFGKVVGIDEIEVF